MKNEMSKEVHKRLMNSLDTSKQTKPKFTDAEQRCISRNIREKVKEGIPLQQAIAASISICAPKKEQKLNEAELLKLWEEMSGESSSAGTQAG